ncbi:phytoene desaturase [Micrococcales bacterium KH10]|nr:phytoene desaturase [Micrococcales bacterium KH10]
MTTTADIRTVVIGGGIAGLSTATLLAREGHHVTLLEKNAQVGGRTGIFEKDGFRFDTGPSWYLMPQVFEHFFQLLGTSAAEQLDLEYLHPAYRVFAQPTGDDTDRRHREPVTIPYGRQRVREVFEQIEPGSGARFDRYLASSIRTTELAQRYFLYNPFTRWRSLIRREVLTGIPKLVSLLATSLERYVAQRFKDPVLRQILGYPAVFLGTNPADAPAMYHLMSALDLGEGVQYPMGGFHRIVERLEELARASGVEIKTNAQVTHIRTGDLLQHGSQLTRSLRRIWPSGQRRQVRGVSWRDRSAVEHFETADYVVSAADLHHTETSLLSASERSYPQRWWNRRTSGPGAVIALLGVRGELPELPHHSLFFTEDWTKNFDAIFGDHPQIPDPASLYVCKPSATDDTVAPRGHENLFVLIPVPADPRIGHGGTAHSADPLVEQTVNTAIEQIAKWADIPDLHERIVVQQTIGPADFATDYFSWKGGMLGPAHTLSQSAMFRPANTSKKVRGLLYSGATTSPGVGVPMCLISAELVLKSIRGDHTPGPLPTADQTDGGA